MSTLYDLFKLSENATQEQIKQAYDNIIKKADSLPENEKIIQQIRRVKIAYGILSNPEKREKYDFDLAAKRAQALLENVQIKEKQELVENKTEKQIEQERRIKQAIDEHLENIAKQQKVKQEKQNRTKERKEKRQAKKEKGNVCLWCLFRKTRLLRKISVDLAENQKIVNYHHFYYNCLISNVANSFCKANFD